MRYRLTSTPLITHCCHCLNCQQQTGSAFVVNLLIEESRFELLAGEPRAVDVPRERGATQRIYRCPSCGIAVFSEYGGPALRFVRAGTLDGGARVEPDVHIYTRSKIRWVTLPESVPAFEEFYDLPAVWRPESLERLEAAMAPYT